MLVPDAPGTTDLPKGFDRSASRTPRRLPRRKPAWTKTIQGARRRSPDGVPEHRGQAAGNRSRRRAAPGVCARRASRRRRSGVRVFRCRAQGAHAARRASLPGRPDTAPPRNLADLPGHPDSWKHTRFAEGNVQLSFSKDAMPLPGGDRASMVHSADVDIDLGRGLAHAKEWLENNVFKPGHKTSQALVYALLYAQGILPRYILDPAADTTARVAPRLRTIAPPSTRARAVRKPVRRATRRAGKKETQVGSRPNRKPDDHRTRQRTTRSNYF